MAILTKKRRVSGVLAAALMAGAAVTVTAQAAPELALDHGHVDAFNVSYTGGGLTLDLKEDVTGQHVRHAPESVKLVVKEEALTDIPSGFPGAPKAYFLPITQNPKLVWPGWDTLGVSGSGIEKVRISVKAVNGPGEVHVFSSDMFGIRSLLEGGGTKLPGVIDQKYPAHTHANWVFTKAGAYTFTVQASADKDGKTLTSNTATYTWQVGKEVAPTPTAPAPKPTATAPAPKPTATAPAPKPTATAPAPKQTATAPAPKQTAKPTTPSKPTAKPTAPASSKPKAPKTEQPVCTPKQVSETVKRPVASSGHFDMGVQPVGGKLVARVKDDRKAPPTWVNPSSLLFAVDDKAKVALPAGYGFLGKQGSPAWFISSTQQAGVPWLGQNTMHESIVNGTTGPVTWTLVGVDGPGRVAVFNSGVFGGGVGQRVFDNAGGPKTYTVPANTHAHPNWAFTAPGEYKVTIKQTATLKDGKSVSATSTLTFVVGGDASTRTITRTVHVDAKGKPCTPANGSGGEGSAPGDKPKLPKSGN